MNLFCFPDSDVCTLKYTYFVGLPIDSSYLQLEQDGVSVEDDKLHRCAT